ncbi:hypothetical protein [Streptomyces sp. NPDC005969]|uniref:hypothetical protein n=1 Tax=Streptomyces sp. NPDC005969 TaxID=3156722 RepID=UPI0033C8C59A
MPIVDVHGARRAAQVEADTWGHLAPETGRVYTGSIVFAHGKYGDVIPLQASFEDLPDSPWFFHGLMDFIGAQDTEPGMVYRFSGTYQMPEDGPHVFTGTVSPVDIAS